MHSQDKNKNQSTKKLPYMQLYTRDLRDGWRLLTFEEKGLYMEILTHLHDGEDVPADVTKLARFLHCNPRTVKKLLPALLAHNKLFISNSCLHNRRVCRDRSKRVDSEFDANSAPIHAELSANSAPIQREKSKNTNEITVDKSPIPETRNQSPKSKERKEREGGTAAALARPAPAVDPLLIFENWNAIALELGLSQTRSLTPSRRKSINARTREHGADAWTAAWASIRRSAFLQGRNDRGWSIDFDFLIGPKNFAKVTEGVYGNGAHAQPQISLAQAARERMAAQSKGASA